jgi:hypothetical protein
MPPDYVGDHEAWEVESSSALAFLALHKRKRRVIACCGIKYPQQYQWPGILPHNLGAFEHFAVSPKKPSYGSCRLRSV